ncbi:MAG: peptidase S41, partial [bacterium]|nr:peptidase S41 [bacterium]
FYINLENIKDFEAEVEKLTRAKAIIFDGRGYIGYRKKDILSHLVDETIDSPVWKSLTAIYPDRERLKFTESRWQVPARQPRLKAKLVFLTNANAMSASETFMAMVAHYKIGEIVGQPTAGVNGDVNTFLLPGEYLINWTGLRVLNHDRTQFHTIGIQPTVPLQRTIKAVKEGRDEYLEKALEIIKKAK